jgi:hypothetical protein
MNECFAGVSDQSRHTCGMAIAITNFEALHCNRPHSTLVALPATKYPFPGDAYDSPNRVLCPTLNWWQTGSGKGMVAVEDAKTHKCDAGRMWVMREAHNQTRCVPATPILCGQIVRLQNMITHSNLHSGFVESPAIRQQEVSHEGKAGHGSTLDNWQIQVSHRT